MRHRFIIYELSHTVLAVDITEIGLPTEIHPPEGKQQSVPTLRFKSWNDARNYLSGIGADEEALAGVTRQMRGAGLAALTIV